MPAKASPPTGAPRSYQSVIEEMARTVELTEEALAQLGRIAIEEIHSGLQTSSHLEAAEHDLRTALRELVLAESQLRASVGLDAELDEPSGDASLLGLA